jgi:hypothetical protein
MRNGFLRILTLGFIAVLLFATLPGQATQAQPAESPIQDDQRVDSQSTLDMINQTEYLAQSAPLLSESANNPAGAYTATTATERSLNAVLDDELYDVDWSCLGCGLFFEYSQLLSQGCQSRIDGLITQNITLRLKTDHRGTHIIYLCL